MKAKSTSGQVEVDQGMGLVLGFRGAECRKRVVA
jgi:hypothetical protein